MKKLFVSIGAMLFIATAIFVWSRTALVSLQASTATPIIVGSTAAQAAVSISPLDMMMHQQSPPPTEQWDPI
jgi:hypothetical protein